MTSSPSIGGVSGAPGHFARRAYIDWARGVAVLLMMEAHTIDAWTRLRDKSTIAYGYGTVLGGFAAPLFLWLAGVGVVMSASKKADRAGSRLAGAASACARGAEIFILAFLFRVQAFIVSPGSHPVTIFKVDVLNVMGPALAASSLLWLLGMGVVPQVLVFGAAASLTALVTPVARASAVVDALPVWLQWYVRPAGEFTTFTLLPWSGFVFAGAAVGALLAQPAGRTADRTVRVGIAVAGATLVGVGLAAAARPSIYSVPVYFWTSSPTWFAIRVGILMMALAALSFLRPSTVLEPLAVLGRSSLFIYWIHVELVYGYASWFWRHRMPIWLWACAYLAFAVLMYRAIGLRDWFVQNRERRISAPPAVSEA